MDGTVWLPEQPATNITSSQIINSICHIEVGHCLSCLCAYLKNRKSVLFNNKQIAPSICEFLKTKTVYGIYINKGSFR